MTDIIKTNHGRLPLFEIIFKDDSVFKGGTSYFQTDWMSIKVNKPIRRIFYLLPSGDYLCLGGYEKYFRMTEATSDLNGKNKGKTILRYDYIMCLKGDKVRSYRITLNNNKDDKFKMSDITTRIFSVKDDRIVKLNGDVWRG